MKPSEYAQADLEGLHQERKNSNGFYIRRCRALIFSMLEKLKGGGIALSEAGEEYFFGVKTGFVVRIEVNSPSVYSRVLWGGTTGSAESYMDSDWVCDDLVALVELMVLNQTRLGNMDSRWSWLSKRFYSFRDACRKNTLSGSKKNISEHYDLSNDFFSLMLDKNKMYSSAIYRKENESLDSAAEYKLRYICEKLKLRATDHLLEIGTGWGGMAVYAAKYFGCRVTTTTLSEEQYTHACEWVEGEGLQDKITVLKKDYRVLEGQYDKLVSIEMIEAVGHQYYDTFFKKCNQLLTQKGLMLIQAITIPDQRYERVKNNADFIRTYIFPGGCLPSNGVITRSIASQTDMHLMNMDDITLDYAKTLSEWRLRFIKQLEQVKQLGFDQRFINMWMYYLCYCEGGFRQRAIHTAQFLFAKPKVAPWYEQA